MIRRSTVVDILTSLPKSLDPGDRTRRAVQSLELDGVVRIAAIGKAAIPMAAAALDVLGGRVVGGVVVSPEPGKVGDLEVVVGSHPNPDQWSERAGRRLMASVARRDHDHLLALVSGGGSALAEVPKPPLTIEDLAAVSERLMRVGTPIDELNLVRRHLSMIKHGGLAAATAAKVTTLVLSDVGNGPPSMVASGPTLADGSTSLDALRVLERRLGRPVQHAVRSALARSVRRPPESDVVVVADRHTAFAEVAHRFALSSVGRPEAVHLEGHADAMAVAMVSQPGLRVGTGETVVNVTGDGIGGRNQHGALAAAIALDGKEGVFGSLGTDGIDGPTDAAGAVVDGHTAARIRARGIDPADALRRCDSHTALDAVGALIRTGPTGTNVADVWISYVPTTT